MRSWETVTYDGVHKQKWYAGISTHGDISFVPVSQLVEVGFN